MPETFSEAMFGSLDAGNRDLEYLWALGDWMDWADDSVCEEAVAVCPLWESVSDGLERWRGDSEEAGGFVGCGAAGTRRSEAGRGLGGWGRKSPECYNSAFCLTQSGRKVGDAI